MSNDQAMRRLTKWNVESSQPVRFDVAEQLKAELDEALARLRKANAALKQQREKSRQLAKAGDEMAKWFPFSSTHMKRVVEQWNEAKRARR